MRVLLTAVAVCGVLTACAAPQAPNDQDQYFDNITPDPSALQAENNRLRSAETGTATAQTVTLPSDTATDTVVTENAEISRTQDFKVVTEKETIASDAAKLAALKESYTVIEPEALPTRKGSRVNLAAYALSQKHAVGTKKFRRFSLGSTGCSRYRKDPDAAQIAFLEAGGPAKDRKRLDGDGDGFACDWNPETYRSLLQNVEATPVVSETPASDS
ncbi:hypothetical protein [Amylibacter sp. IMCC11727]|uniref:hypothetical protein n=1 Tax=Amylibacter sp. IMCC11727 TaxID=3039851 RepID=UPI00244D9B6A|nr:hypothetical protein [Amylibacter sp. IMCC11727]WGI22989.1 hypothetical protein QBD29_06095 [Amylibacter sp. IMCC11727]